MYFHRAVQDALEEQKAQASNLDLGRIKVT